MFWLIPIDSMFRSLGAFFVFPFVYLAFSELFHFDPLPYLGIWLQLRILPPPFRLVV